MGKKIRFGWATWIASAGCWIFSAYGTEGLLREEYVSYLAEEVSDSVVEDVFSEWATVRIGVQKGTFPIVLER